MKKSLKITIILFLIILISIFLYFNVFTIMKSPECFLGGGTWRLHSSTCVDSCAWERGEVVACALAITWGCDCGPNKCWNGERCELN